MAEQVQLFGDPASGRGTARAKPGSREESFLCRGLALRSVLSLSGDGATHLHLELGRRCGCLRLGRSESGLNLSLCPFHSTRDKKQKIETKSTSTPGEKGCVSATQELRQGWMLLSLGSRIAGTGAEMWEEHWSGVGRLSLWILGL